MAKQKTHEEFIGDFDKNGNPNIVVIGKSVNKKTKILVKCKIDGYEWYAWPDNLLHGVGCPVCVGKVVIPNLNSVAALRPDLVRYFEDPADAYSITPGSTKKVNLICPDCGERRIMHMFDLSRLGFNCQVCGQYISYPNRLIRNVMKWFDAEVDCLQYEWSQRWTEKQRYDVYFEINNQKYVIEMQGRQHYENGWYSGEPLDAIVCRDKNKLRLAIEHNIIPIIIDARKSDDRFIIHNICSSLLSEIFDLSIVDWEQCKVDAAKNIIKQVCDYYCKNPNISITNLAKEHHIHKVTAMRYLKIGNEFGWCMYSTGMSNEKHKQRMSKRINVFDRQMMLVCTYNSVSECAKLLSEIYGVLFTRTSIRRACIEDCKSYHGLYFEYA